MSRTSWLRIGYSLIVAAVCVFISMGGVDTVAAKPANALNDPLVVVVRAEPLTSCRLVITQTWGTQEVVTTRSQCPAGSVIGTVHIPLSQALASQEPYVLLPSHDVSAAVQARVKQQIFALLQAAGSHATDVAEQPTYTAKVQPLTCSGSYYVEAWWYPSFDKGTTYHSRMDYQRCGNNSIFLSQSRIQLDGGFGYYWDHDQYASGSWGRGCKQIPTYNIYGGLNSTHTAGYYYEPYVSSGSNCTWFDNYSYYDVGPAN